MKKNLKVYSLTPKILVLGVLFVMALSGCQNAGGVGSKFVSVKGVNIEGLMPADAILMAKLGTNDKVQLDNLKTLNSYFPNDPMGTLTKSFNKEFKDGAKFQEIGLDFEKDILPIISDKTEIYFALSPNQGKSSFPRMVVAMTLASEAKFDEVLNKGVGQNGLKKEGYSGLSVYSSKEVKEEGEQMYVVRLEDTALMATTMELIKSAVDANKNKTDLLAVNPVFKKALAKQDKSGVFFAFIDLSKLMAYLKTSSDSESYENFDEILKVAGVKGNEINAVESEVFMISAEKDGFRMNTVVLAKDGSDLAALTAAAPASYLLKKIPAKNPLIYMEGYNLKMAYETLTAAMAAQQNSEFSLDEIKVALVEQGLDLDKDILSFMDKGFAFLFDDNDSIIPSFGLFVDVSSNPGGAAKVMLKLHEQVESGFASEPLESPEFSKVFAREDVVKDKLWKIKVNLDSVLVDAPPFIASKLSGQKIELYYGLTDDNVMFIAFKPDFEKSWGKESDSVSKTKEFANAMNYVQGAQKGLTYMSPSQLMIFADKLVSVSKESGADIGTEYEEAKSYMIPIKSIIFGSGLVAKEQVVGQAFLHIGQ